MPAPTPRPMSTPEQVEAILGPVEACRECHGTGSKPYASMHPMCSRCYGTGRAGVTLGDLEQQARLARELKSEAR